MFLATFLAVSIDYLLITWKIKKPGNPDITRISRVLK